MLATSEYTGTATRLIPTDAVSASLSERETRTMLMTQVTMALRNVHIRTIESNCRVPMIRRYPSPRSGLGMRHRLVRQVGLHALRGLHLAELAPFLDLPHGD